MNQRSTNRKIIVIAVVISVLLATGAAIVAASTQTDRSSRLTADANQLRTVASDLEQMAADETSTTAAVTTTTLPSTTQPATTVATTTIPPTTTTTQPASGGFLSYPHQSGPQTFSGNNLNISNKSWVGFGSDCLTVSNAVNVTINNVDFDGCVGDIFLINVTGNIRITNVRANNTGNGTIGSGHSNVIQFNNSWQSAPSGSGYGIFNVKALGGDTEDMISIFKSGGVDASHPLLLDSLRMEHPLSGPQAWSSGSGTCINLADAGGHDMILQNSTFLNCGAVGIQLNLPDRVQVNHNIVYGAQRTKSNVGLSQFGSNCPCTGTSFTNNRVWWKNSSGSANPVFTQNKSVVVASSNVLQDTTIDPNTLHVVL